MSLFRPQGAPERREANLDTTAELIQRARYGGPIWAGQPVNDDSAMRLSSVWGCTDLIAELVSTMPIDEYRQGDNGIPQQLDTPRILSDPGGDGYGFEVWARSVMMSWLLRGNAYGLVEQMERDNPTVITPLHPDRISILRTKSFGPVTWFLDGQQIDRYPYGAAQLWHVPAYSIPGTPLGLSPISYAAQTIGLGIATQKFGAQWFGDGAHPTAMINGDGPIPEDEAKIIKARVMRIMEGNREPLVLGGGYKLEAIQVAPEESQFLETIKATSDDIARFFFRRPPGEGGQVTYANVEARSLDLLTYTINGWLVRLERALTRLRPRGRYVKFNAGAMLRTDTKTRYEAHALAVRSGVETPNERRRLEDKPPLPGGDELLWPPFSTTAAGDTSTGEESQSDAAP